MGENDCEVNSVDEWWKAWVCAMRMSHRCFCRPLCSHSFPLWLDSHTSVSYRCVLLMTLLATPDLPANSVNPEAILKGPISQSSCLWLLIYFMRKEDNSCAVEDMLLLVLRSRQQLLRWRRAWVLPHLLGLIAALVPIHQQLGRSSVGRKASFPHKASTKWIMGEVGAANAVSLDHGETYSYKKI